MPVDHGGRRSLGWGKQVTDMDGPVSVCGVEIPDRPQDATAAVPPGAFKTAVARAGRPKMARTALAHHPRAPAFGADSREKASLGTHGTYVC